VLSVYLIVLVITFDNHRRESRGVRNEVKSEKQLKLPVIKLNMGVGI